MGEQAMRSLRQHVVLPLALGLLMASTTGCSTFHYPRVWNGELPREIDDKLVILRNDWFMVGVTARTIVCGIQCPTGGPASRASASFSTRVPNRSGAAPTAREASRYRLARAGSAARFRPRRGRGRAVPSGSALDALAARFDEDPELVQRTLLALAMPRL